MHRLLWCLCLCLHFPEVVSTKDASTSLPMTSGMQSSSFPWQRKRAYNRACRRAMEHGTTIYRGRPFQLPTGSTLLRSEGVTRSSMRRHHDRSSGRRLRMLTWNCGGASAIYDQFLLWLFQSRVEMAVLVETKWSFSQCWSDQHYHYIHSGAGSRKSSGGVLVILSRQLTHSQAIRYHEAIPGHLLHVSFTPHGSSCAFNLIGLYQHVWTSGNLSIRHTFWTKLSGLCHSIPARSCLLLAGDCNATCQPEGRLVGSGVPKSFVAEDSSELQDILRAHGLVALNTFGQAPGHTFRFGPRASQLDYVFTRIAHADREAKLAKANYDFPECMCRLMQPTTSLSLLLLLAPGIHVLIVRIASTLTSTDWLRMYRRGRRKSMRFSARSPGIGVQSNPWTPQILKRACKLLTILYCPLQGLFFLRKGRRNLLHGRINYRRDVRHVCGL